MPHTTPSLEQSYLSLVKFIMLSKRRLLEMGSDYDLTGMQAMVIFMLDVPRPMHGFKTMFQCDASYITGLVDVLEAKNLVSRYEDPKDRRSKMIQLEAKGQQVRQGLLRQSAAADSPLFAKLDRREFKTFMDLLYKLTDGQDV